MEYAVCTVNRGVTAVSTLKIYLVSQYHIFILDNTPNLCRPHAKSSSQNDQSTSLVVGVSYTFRLVTFLDVSGFTDFNIVQCSCYGFFAFSLIFMRRNV